MTVSPRRGEIWSANLGDPPLRHWVLIVSVDGRNLSDRIDSVLVVPFSSRGAEGPTVVPLPAGETGLPGPSFLKAHFISVFPKRGLISREGRALSRYRMREVVAAMRRAVDPEAPWPEAE